MTKLESENQRRFGSLISLPLFVLFAVLGFGSPVFFSAISQTSLEDVGEGTKTLDEEMVRQLRQNNLGPAEMLLPLTSVDRREEYSESIDKKMTPKLEISGGGSIFDLLAFESYFGGLDKFNTDRKRYEAFFVYNKATVQGDLQKRLSEESSNTNVRALLQAIPKEGRPGNFWSRLLAEPMVSAFPGVKMVEIVGFPFFLTAKLFYQLVYRIWKIWIRTNLKQKFATNVWPLLEMPSPSVRAVQHGFLSKRTKRVRMLANWMEIKLCHLLILKISPRDWVY